MLRLVALTVVILCSTTNRATRLLADAGPTVSVREAAVVLGCSSDLVRSMHRRGELAGLGIRVLRLGSRVRISTMSLRRALEIGEGAG